VIKAISQTFNVKFVDLVLPSHDVMFSSILGISLASCELYHLLNTPFEVIWLASQKLYKLSNVSYENC